jgi:translation initiation factor 3 subunit B
MFGFSADDAYFASAKNDTLGVFSARSSICELIDKQPFVTSSTLRDFAFSPADAQTLAYWQAEDGEKPARFIVVEVPSKVETANKTVYSVADCALKWHRSGDFLCLQVQRYAKKVKKEKQEGGPPGQKGTVVGGWQYQGTYYTLEIFHIREKHCPVITVDEFKKGA